MFEATCAGGREFNPRPGQYSRMSFSSDQVTGKVFSSEHAFPSKLNLFRTLSSWGSSNYRPGLDIDRWPAGRLARRLFLLGGPVRASVSSTGGAASVSSGHKGVRSALARSANQIETLPPSELFSGGWSVSQFISGK